MGKEGEVKIEWNEDLKRGKREERIYVLRKEKEVKM